MTGKRYRLEPGDFVAGLADDSPCIASDRILVDGLTVGYLYRGEWGWNLFSGDEDQGYLDDAANLSLLTLNEAANFDRAIVPYLDAPVGTAWIRAGDQFVPDPEGAPTEAREADGPAAESVDGLDPDFPTVSGTIAITTAWGIALPGPMNVRNEEGSLVLWRPGITAWLTVWSAPEDESAADRFSALVDMVSPQAYDRTESSAGEVLRLAYRLAEPASDRRCDALYGFTVGPSGHAQAAVYFDDEGFLADAHHLLEHLGPTAAEA